MGTGRNKLSNKHWERTFQKDSTLCHTISTVYTKLENILMDKWHLIQNQLLDPLLRQIFRELPLISCRKGESIKDMLVKAITLKRL